MTLPYSPTNFEDSFVGGTRLVENRLVKSHGICYKHLVGASRRLALRLQIQLTGG